MVVVDKENFVNLMNAKATELGMKNTLFYNASGLPTPHGKYSSCYDMALLTRYVMKNKLMSYELYPEKIDVDCVQRLDEDELYDKYLV